MFEQIKSLFAILIALSKKGIVAQLIPALVVPLLLIIFVAIYTQFSSNVDRASWTTSANDTYDKINTGTWGGYKLASMLPYIIIAVAVLGILIGAFAFGGRF